MLARLCLYLVALLAGCAGSEGTIFPSEVNDPARTVYVVRHDWHAGIVVSRSDIPEDTWPALYDFPQARYLEVGWGDREFYQAPDPSLGLAIKALLWTTPGVVHIVGFDAPVEEFFAASEIVALSVSVRGFEALCGFIGDAYARDERGNAQGLGPGLYGTSRFYASSLKYSLFATCNVWTARALQAAGCPIDPDSAVTVTGLLQQVRKVGEVVQTGR